MEKRSSNEVNWKQSSSMEICHAYAVASLLPLMDAVFEQVQAIKPSGCARTKSYVVLVGWMWRKQARKTVPLMYPPRSCILMHGWDATRSNLHRADMFEFFRYVSFPVSFPFPFSFSTMHELIVLWPSRRVNEWLYIQASEAKNHACVLILESIYLYRSIYFSHICIYS